ncbi:hypothetical protein [Enterobacter pseudoroggenkampii]|jgi:EAL domain-containing protein (putative c-di-GMP-specific phosphodiesterase class I)|uniref:EAL domain-containing protein n=2 Tax=Enterobacteriaceae TaxID=543 RepID=A0ABT3X708_9ENTR|nr:hypothetical protein [Enterobacter pseudoroggenkampii]MCK6906086.1 hypothetical protein [Enterobacter roggenkampii]MCX8301606.1 hypothetical protein [Enterobacter pseudoroggenkampii]
MFTFDKIKIDGSFVKDAVVRPDCATVARAVAEGVETQEQFDRILEEGVQRYRVIFTRLPFRAKETLLPWKG